jgi:hypothetical protein
MSCPTGKIEHLSRKAAEAHAESIFNKDGHLPNIYICPDYNCLHVGGGRASDRPVVRAQQTKTPWRERMPHPKPGKTRTVDELILEELIHTFKSDMDIAAQLGKKFWHVQKVRKTLDIPTYKERRAEAIIALARAFPLLNSKNIAHKLKVDMQTVYIVCRNAKIVLPKIPQPKGIHAHMYGKKLSAETKAIMAEKQRKAWERNPNRNKHQFTAEDAARSSETLKLPYIRTKRKREMKKLWEKPEYRNKITAAITTRSNDSEYLAKEKARIRKDREEHPEKYAASTAMAAARIRELWKNPAFVAKVKISSRKAATGRKPRPWTSEERKAQSEWNLHRTPEFNAWIARKVAAAKNGLPFTEPKPNILYKDATSPP